MTSPTRKAAEQRGRLAERYAGGILTLKGYSILAKRAKTPVGEIDLIARKGNLLAFIEVKQRRTLEQGLNAVPDQSWNRIARASDSWLARYAPDKFDYDRRYDLFLVIGNFGFRHMKDTWRPDSFLTRN